MLTFPFGMDHAKTFFSQTNPRDEIFSKRLLIPAESQKPFQRISNADRKVFANPESFCDMLIIG